ncbi:MAG TPA: hypothetical protein VFG63_09990 [Nocardioidaceae bacterium]|nr:hypothetical protein [Nocardioidaceae bacterium]
MSRYLQLLAACTVLGAGVAFLLEAALGSDGYSSLVSGLTIASGLPFWLLNILVGAAFIAMAWMRGTRPGPGTVVQWFLVGFVISAVMALVPQVDTWTGRITFLVLAFVLIAAGVAGYLASNTGAGPAEAAALAWDPPIPFRWSYSLVQGGGALVGWLFGAAIGPGTILVIVLLGPAVDALRRTVPHLERPHPERG